MVECGSLRRYRFICGMTAIFLLNGLALAALSVVDKVIVSIYCISRAVSCFYETEFEIRAGFGPVWQFIIHEFFRSILN